MIVYLDSSVLLRKLLGEPGRLAEWTAIEAAVCSEICRVECLRTIDRMRHEAGLEDGSVATLREGVFRAMDHVEIVGVTRVVLSRAAMPFPVPVKTLDAIHLSTALLWQEVRERPMVMATHDTALGRAARSVGMQVVGC